MGGYAFYSGIFAQRFNVGALNYCFRAAASLRAEKQIEILTLFSPFVQKLGKEERNARTRRLCERMGLIESMLPETITLTADNFKIYLEKTITTDNSRRILDGLLTEQTASRPAPTSAESAARPVITPATKPAETERDGDTDEGQDGGNMGRATV